MIRRKASHLEWFGLPTLAGVGFGIYELRGEWVLESLEWLGEVTPERVPAHGAHRLRHFQSLRDAVLAAPGPIHLPLTVWTCARLPPPKGGRIDSVRLMPTGMLGGVPDGTWRLFHFQVSPDGEAHYHGDALEGPYGLLEAMERAEAILSSPGEAGGEEPLCPCLEPSPG